MLVVVFVSILHFCFPICALAQAKSKSKSKWRRTGTCWLQLNTFVLSLFLWWLLAVLIFQNKKQFAIVSVTFVAFFAPIAGSAFCFRLFKCYLLTFVFIAKVRIDASWLQIFTTLFNARLRKILAARDDETSVKWQFLSKQ